MNPGEDDNSSDEDDAVKEVRLSDRNDENGNGMVEPRRSGLKCAE